MRNNRWCKERNTAAKCIRCKCGRNLDLILQSPTFKNYKFSDKPDLVNNAATARVAATEGMVLLKNKDNALPFSSIKKIALFGAHGYDLIAGGTGSGDVNKAYKISLSQGLTNANFTLADEVKSAYTNYISDYNSKNAPQTIIEQFMHPRAPMPEYDFANDSIIKHAAAADIAIITIGRNAGEGKDRQVENDFNLSETEKMLLKNVSTAFHQQHKKVVVVLNIGGIIETASWRDEADAILLAWQPGLEGGNAMADILSGKVNPSGRLAVTFPASYNDVPSAKNFPGTEFPDKATSGMFGMKRIPAEVTYEEGIYVGYRYFNTFNMKPAYPFGFGLSYTSFEFDDLHLSSAVFNNNISATVTIKNTGNAAGKEVVQLYISARVNKLDKPAEELKAFAKTKTLQPGETQMVSFIISADALASFNTNTSSWIADAGNYMVKIGASSEDIVQTASFQLTKDIVTEKDSKLLAPTKNINELKR